MELKKTRYLLFFLAILTPSTALLAKENLFNLLKSAEIGFKHEVFEKGVIKSKSYHKKFNIPKIESFFEENSFANSFLQNVKSLIELSDYLIIIKSLNHPPYPVLNTKKFELFKNGIAKLYSDLEYFSSEHSFISESLKQSSCSINSKKEIVDAGEVLYQCLHLIKHNLLFYSLIPKKERLHFSNIYKNSFLPILEKREKIIRNISTIFFKSEVNEKFHFIISFLGKMAFKNYNEDLYQFHENLSYALKQMGPDFEINPDDSLNILSSMKIRICFDEIENSGDLILDNCSENVSFISTKGNSYKPFMELKKIHNKHYVSIKILGQGSYKRVHLAIPLGPFYYSSRLSENDFEEKRETKNKKHVLIGPKLKLKYDEKKVSPYHSTLSSNITEMNILDQIRRLPEKEQVGLEVAHQIQSFEHGFNFTIITDPLKPIVNDPSDPFQTDFNIFLSCAIGLKTLHRTLNVIHNDLKPDNLMVDEEKRMCRIIDFGLANNKHFLLKKLQPQEVKSFIYKQSLSGTRGYLPPEKLLEMGKRNSKLGFPFFTEEQIEKGDVYSLALSFYTIMTGQYPYNECHPSIPFMNTFGLREAHDEINCEQATYNKLYSRYLFEDNLLIMAIMDGFRPNLKSRLNSSQFVEKLRKLLPQKISK